MPVPAPHTVRSPLSLATSTLLLVIAACYAFTGLVAIANHAWREPMFDQFRLYVDYLGRAFPDNILQLENGHRPIVPALIRVAEIEWWSADQMLQIVFGASCVALTLALLAGAVWRDRDRLATTTRAAGVAAAAMAVLWLANARMLLHGNELVHAYLLTSCVVASALLACRATDAPHGLRRIVAATALCVVATFCFGPGIALFPALVVLMVLLRLPLRWTIIPLSTLAATLIVYLWVLPGDGGVRAVLDFRPVDSVLMAARWIASPWVNAWLGLADPPLLPWLADRATHDATLGFLRTTATFGQDTLGVSWRTHGAAVIGLAGFAFVGTTVVMHLWRRHVPSVSESVAIGVALFGGATSLIIGVGRLAYLEALPDQIYADRYLVWPCLFWLGCALIAMHRLDSRGIAARTLVAATVVAVAAALVPTHRAWLGWGATVARISLASGAAARSEVFLTEHHPDDDAAPWSSRIKAIDLFRERHLAMYALDESRWLGRTVNVDDQPRGSATIVRTRHVADLRDNAPAAHIEGLVDGSARARGTALAVVDTDGVVRGFGVRSFQGYDGTSMWAVLPAKRGFDAYIHGYRTDQAYRLVDLDTAGGNATLLVAIPPIP